jgi:integrase/recombinase XerD
MATDFAVALRRFLTSYLAGLRGCSPNTIASYRDTFKLLIAWFRDEQAVPPGKLTLDHIDAAAVTAFLGWLQEGRRNGVSTRNQRLAAISSFCTWMQTEDPSRMACWQDIIAIPAKKQDRPAVSHLTVEQARRLLAQPDRSTRQGRRDATLLATLYDTGARVQELADLDVRDIRLQHPAMASLTGKGRKTRHVPLAGNTITLLAAYLEEHRLDQPGRDDHPVFYGQRRAQLSRGGIAWIIRKYQDQISDPPLAGTSISPHILRHSKASTYTRQEFRCPTSATSSAMSTCPPPRSTPEPRPRRNAKPSKPPTPASSPPTYPNGTKTPASSTGSPASDQPSGIMRSARPPIPLLPGRPGQHCA